MLYRAPEASLMHTYLLVLRNLLVKSPLGFRDSIANAAVAGAGSGLALHALISIDIHFYTSNSPVGRRFKTLPGAIIYSVGTAAFADYLWNLWINAL